MKSKMLPTIIASLAFAAVPVAFGATYQMELAAAYGEVDVDNYSTSQNDYSLSGTYYFSLVDTKNRPLAESAFLQKAGSVYVRGDYSRYESSYSSLDYTSEARVYGRELGADIYIPNSVFYLGGGVREFKARSEWNYGENKGSSSDDWDSRWYVKAGVTPVDGMLVWSEFYEDVDVSDYWNINAKYVMPIGAEGHWLNLEARYETTEDDEDDSQSFSIAGDYYLDSHLSLGGGVTHYTYDDDYSNENENEYFVRANQYFTENFAVNLRYADGDYESSWALGATLRF